LNTFLAQKPIRYMVSQPENKLDFAHIMDSGKILLAKLPEGLLGRENSYLLGTLLVSKFQQIAMSRQAQRIEARRMFNIVIDEFANFITPSMAEILSGARKYRIGLTLAHHELHQLERSPDVASAVLTHPYTRIVFRVGDDDAKKLAEGFSYFESKDLRNLEIGQAICRVERSDFDFNLTVPLPDEPDMDEATARRQEVITVSRGKYATPRTDVEAMLAKSRMAPPDVQPPTSPTARLESTSSTKPNQPTEIVPQLPPASVVPKSGDTPVPTELPHAQEVPKALKPVAKGTPPATRELGRGGAQHQAIQKRIKEAAEALGFRSVIERAVLDGQGSVDLWLERADKTIACEISISTTVDHEVGNVKKCLAAGVPQVAIVCVSDDRLHNIAAAVSGSLGAEAAARVAYYQPDPFIAYLKTLPPPQEAPVTKRGYKVKRSIPALTDKEQRQREDLANQMMAEALRRK
jgi:hypothetical protein